MQIGDIVVWAQIKHCDNQTELTKLEGAIQAISGDKATVLRPCGKKNVVQMSELTLKSEDEPMSLVGYAFSRFGSGGSALSFEPLRLQAVTA